MGSVGRKVAARERLVSRVLVLLLMLPLWGCQKRFGAVPTPMGPVDAPPTPTVLQTVQYQVTQTFVLVNQGDGQPSKQNLWIALIGDVSPYQSVQSMEIAPSGYQLMTDEYGNRYAEFDLSDMSPGESIQIRLEYVVDVRALAYDLTECRGDTADEFTEAELHIESNNIQIVELSQKLSEDRGTVCEQIRAFYDYLGDNLVYSYNSADWGAQAALGEMGADCTEYASLLIALSRAAGIPARYLEGLWALGEKRRADARTEHAWVEVYLPGLGWTPMDPTLGRSSLRREAYFAQLPPEHIIVTVGRNPSTLRGSSYFTHLYWPGKSTEIRITEFDWLVTPADE